MIPPAPPLIPLKHPNHPPVAPQAALSQLKPREPVIYSTEAPCSILSGFTWIKRKVKQRKAIKRFLQVTPATSVFLLILHHVSLI